MLVVFFLSINIREYGFSSQVAPPLYSLYTGINDLNSSLSSQEGSHKRDTIGLPGLLLRHQR